MKNENQSNSSDILDRIGGVVIDNRTITLRTPSYNKRYYPSYEYQSELLTCELELLNIKLRNDRLYIVIMEFGNFGNSSDSDNQGQSFSEIVSKKNVQSKAFLDHLKKLGSDDRNFICTPPILRTVPKKELEYTKFSILQCPEKNTKGKKYTKNDISYSFEFDFLPKYQTNKKLKIKIKKSL